MAAFTIILPVRNGGSYFKECVNSILNQHHKEFNLLILDNNSTDDNMAWVKSIGDSRISIYLSSENLTIEENWARAVALPKNEYMTLIGHDDLLYPDYLSTMDQLIRQYPDASLYQTHFNYIDAAGKLVRPSQPMKAIQYAHEFLDCQISQTLDSTGTGYMMRSSDYDRLGGISPLYPKLIFADYELWMKLILRSYKATSPNVCFAYRLHDSTSKLTNGEEYQQAFGKYMYFLNDLKGVDPKIVTVLNEKGKTMLLYFCRALSHRLLKTPRSSRTTTVSSFISQCRSYARLLIPGQSFTPLRKPAILAAKLLDNKPGLFLFSLYKKLF